jgi:hypothetical protein
VKFHIDENVPEAVAAGLRRRGFDVTTTPQAGLLGATDEEQLAFAFRESRVIVSHDADMLRLASAGIAHAGIAYCHGRKYKVGPLVLKLLALAGRVGFDAMRGRVEFL